MILYSSITWYCRLGNNFRYYSNMARATKVINLTIQTLYYYREGNHPQKLLSKPNLDLWYYMYPCVFWSQSLCMRLAVWITTLSPSRYSSNIILLEDWKTTPRIKLMFHMGCIQGYLWWVPNIISNFAYNTSRNRRYGMKLNSNSHTEALTYRE